ncbi:MAG: phospho-sugar mutase [Chlamydiales bacterium]|nr:phospho-sugar mutase [Chlamydiales bacterium]
MDNSLSSFDAATQKHINDWLEGPYDDATKAEIQRLLKESPKDLIEAFYTTLSFGTGGLRGVMGIGSNRMNIYTVTAATQGLANYINKQPKTQKEHSVLIGYDCRNNSKLFAEESAKVLAANGIKVYIYSALRPVPLVSFGCRLKKCLSAIMVTASHNPPEYNGYKVYWDDGAQVLPPHDIGIIEEVQKVTDPTQVKFTQLPNDLVEIVHEEIDDAYIKAIKPLQCYPDQNKKQGPKLNIVYTSLYGAGITVVPKVLSDWGFSNLKFVDEQIVPNGDFPTTPSPNPEEKSALLLGIKKLQETSSDILVATDPDSDRMGVVAMHKGEPIIFNGNEIACICLEHILEALTKQNRLPINAAFIKTIVTSELFQSIADSYKKPCFNVLTGFKYIGELIKKWESDPNGYQYIYGGEESYGTLLGTNSRDKDAVIATALIAEVALNAKLQNLTLLDLLHNIYKKQGVFREKLISLTFPGKEGIATMKALMENLRKTPPKTFNNIPIETIDDYKTSEKNHLLTGKQEKLTLPTSDVLVFWLQDKSRLVIRPSGTEPKIKLYGEVSSKTFSSVEEGVKACDAKVTTLLESLKKDLQ